MELLVNIFVAIIVIALVVILVTFFIGLSLVGLAGVILFIFAVFLWCLLVIAWWLVKTIIFTIAYYLYYFFTGKELSGWRPIHFRIHIGSKD